MSLKIKFHQNWNVTKNNHPDWNVTKTEMSLKLKCHYNWNVTKTEMLWKTDVATKLKCYQNWNSTLTEMLQNIKIFSKWNLNPKKIQEIGTDHLGLVCFTFIYIYICLGAFNMKYCYICKQLTTFSFDLLRSKKNLIDLKAYLDRWSVKHG